MPSHTEAIVDKTANFVARNGPSFEERIRENEKQNNKFCFLNPNDPYRPYYDAKVEEFKSGKGISSVNSHKSNRKEKGRYKGIVYSN